MEVVNGHYTGPRCGRVIQNEIGLRCIFDDAECLANIAPSMEHGGK